MIKSPCNSDIPARRSHPRSRTWPDLCIMTTPSVGAKRRFAQGKVASPRAKSLRLGGLPLPPRGLLNKYHHCVQSNERIFKGGESRPFELGAVPCMLWNGKTMGRSRRRGGFLTHAHQHKARFIVASAYRAHALGSKPNAKFILEVC